MKYEVCITYKNHYTELDKQIEKITGKLIKDSGYNFLTGTRELFFVFMSEKTIDLIKKKLKKLLPENSEVTVVIHKIKK